MKKIIMILIFNLCILALNAQISARIEKVNLGSSIHIYTKLTNTCGSTIYVLDGGNIASNNCLVLNYSSSYAVFSAYSANNTLLGKSDKQPFSMPDDNTKVSIKIMPGQSYTMKSLLYNTDGIFGLFVDNYGLNLKYLKANVHLKYLINGVDVDFRNIDIETNQILF